MAGGRRKKRSRGSSSSSTGGLQEKIQKTDMAEKDEGEQNITEAYKMLKDSVDCLRKELSEGFSKMHTEMDILRYELKSDMAEVKSTMKELEKSLEFTQEEVIELKDQAQTTKKEMETLRNDTQEMGKKIEDLTKKLKEQEERNTSLEQYTRRNNLRFNNIQESEGEDCKSLIYDIIDRDLEIDNTRIRFHAVHRVGRTGRQDEQGPSFPDLLVARTEIRSGRVGETCKDQRISMTLTLPKTMRVLFSRKEVS